MGCADKNTTDAICGGHGEMHDSHCHCDAGYTLSEDESTCELNSDETASGNGDGFVFEPQNVQSMTGTNNNAQYWIIEAIDDDVQLRIEIYESFGGLSSPGSIAISEEETNYATCGNCIMLRTGCTLHADHYDCSRTFMPIPNGELQIDAIGTNAGDELNGEIIGVSFEEVTIDQDYQTQAVSNGETINLLNWSFSTEIESR